MFGPRKRPTRSHSRPPSSSPPAGSATLVYAHQAGPHTVPLGQRGLRVPHVPQQVGERQRVEAGIGKRQLLGLPHDQPDAAVTARRRHSPAPLPQHRLGQVHRHHPPRAPRGQLQRHPRRPRRHVEHHPVGRQHPPDHRRPPPPVLPEGQQLREPVIPIRQPLKQVAREPIRTGKVGGHKRISLLNLRRGPATPPYPLPPQNLFLSRTSSGPAPAQYVPPPVLPAPSASLTPVNGVKVPLATF